MFERNKNLGSQEEADRWGLPRQSVHPKCVHGLLDGRDSTWGELTEEEKEEVAHHDRAFAAGEKFCDKYRGNVSQKKLKKVEYSKNLM